MRRWNTTHANLMDPNFWLQPAGECDSGIAQLHAEAPLDWFEEPMPIHRYKEHGTLKAASDVKIATGENGYHLSHFETLMDHNGADILNVDVTICPGYDIAKDITDLALERGVSVAPHGCQELQLPLAAAIPHGEFLEYYPVAVDPLRADMFMPRMVPDDDGYVTVPDRPGIGFELNMEVLNKYKVG